MKFCKTTLQKRMTDYYYTHHMWGVKWVQSLMYMWQLFQLPKSSLLVSLELSVKISKPTSQCTLHDIRKLRPHWEAFLRSHSVYINTSSVLTCIISSSDTWQTSPDRGVCVCPLLDHRHQLRVNFMDDSVHMCIHTPTMHYVCAQNVVKHAQCVALHV